MKPFLNFLIAALFGTLTLLSTLANAAEVPFNKTQFDKLMAERKPIVVHFFADWCPTCKSQKASVIALAADPAFKDVTIFIADYDKEADLKKALRVNIQSTFVVFKGGKEVTRSTGQTKKEDIAATFGKAQQRS